MSASPSLLSPEEFAGKVRAKYPGAYDSLSDQELTTKVVSKYPGYGAQVNLASTGAAKPNVQPKEVYDWTGEEKPENPFASMATGMAKDIGDVSLPNIARQTYNRVTGKPNTLSEIPRKAAMMVGPAMAGEIGGMEPGVPGEAPAEAPAIARPAPKPGPRGVSPSSTGGAMADLASEALPKPLRMAYKIGKILTRDKPAPPTPETPPPVIPETNGIPWGSGGEGPLELRGKMIPSHEPTNVLHSQPEAPTPETLQARGLAVGGRTPVDPSAGLGEIPVRTPEPSPGAAAAPKVRGVGEIRKAVGPDLNRTLGEATNAAPPLARGISLKNQLQTAANKTGPLPEGYTRTPDSTVLRGYKYDPAAQRFDAITNGGTHYAHGEISPEQFETVKNAKSLGKAWQDHVLNGPGAVRIEKNFQPSIPGTMETESGQIIPKSKAGMNLDDQLKTAIGKPDSTAPKVRGVKASAARVPARGERLEDMIKQTLEQMKGKEVESAPVQTSPYQPGKLKLGTFEDNKGGTLYHGTGAPERPFQKGEVVYLANDPEETVPFARGEIPGAGVEHSGKHPAVVNVKARPGKTVSIDDEMQAMVMDGDPLEDEPKIFAAAKAKGARYATFYHPSTGPGGGFRAVVSLYPEQDLVKQSVATLPSK